MTKHQYGTTFEVRNSGPDPLYRGISLNSFAPSQQKITKVKVTVHTQFKISRNRLMSSLGRVIDPNQGRGRIQNPFSTDISYVETSGSLRDIHLGEFGFREEKYAKDSWYLDTPKGRFTISDTAGNGPGFSYTLNLIKDKLLSWNIGIILAKAEMNHNREYMHSMMESQKVSQNVDPEKISKIMSNAVADPFPTPMYNPADDDYISAIGSDEVRKTFKFIDPVIYPTPGSVTTTLPSQPAPGTVTTDAEGPTMTVKDVIQGWRDAVDYQKLMDDMLKDESPKYDYGRGKYKKP